MSEHEPSWVAIETAGHGRYRVPGIRVGNIAVTPKGDGCPGWVLTGVKSGRRAPGWFEFLHLDDAIECAGVVSARIHGWSQDDSQKPPVPKEVIVDIVAEHGGRFDEVEEHP